MGNSKKAWLKSVIFLIVFIIINNLFVFLICPKEPYSSKILKDMYNSDKNIDIAFAGSSYFVYGINPYIIDKELECNTFNYSFRAQSYIGTYYCLEELFKYHNPKLIVLSTDISSFINEQESVEAYAGVIPNIKSFDIKTEYFFDSIKEGKNLNKIFTWRTYNVKSVKDILNNVKKKKSDEYKNYTTSELLNYYEANKDKYGYMGKGFARLSEDNNIINDNKLGKMMIKETNLDKIKDKNIEYFKKISKLCRDNNTELILVQTPYPTFSVFKEKNYFEFSEKIGEIAKDENVDYYDFNLVKPEIFEAKSKYFRDHEHLAATGADIFSKSFTRFLKLRDSGEDMSKYFYTPNEYLQSIDYINNTWFDTMKDGNNITIKADSFYGEQVIPEYQFILTDTKTGKSKVIRDYSTDTTLTIEEPKSNYKIRLNAREKGSDVEYSRYYEKEVKK